MPMNKIVVAHKSGNISVARVDSYAEVEVWTKNGNLETVEHVYADGLVATRVDETGKPVIDAFGHKNSWKISKEVLEKKYTLNEDLGVYVPKGGPQLFVQLAEDTTFLVPWGEDGAMVEQHILAGGWANITNPDDVYGIASEEFAETYVIDREGEVFNQGNNAYNPSVYINRYLSDFVAKPDDIKRDNVRTAIDQFVEDTFINSVERALGHKDPTFSTELIAVYETNVVKETHLYDDIFRDVFSSLTAEQLNEIDDAAWSFVSKFSGSKSRDSIVLAGALSAARKFRQMARATLADRNYFNAKVEEIRMSSIRIYDGYMPIGILTNAVGQEVGYLSPFRGYSFQVSETFNGNGDCGSTQVFGLNNLLDARFGTERKTGYQSNLRMSTAKVYLLKLAAKEAIDKYCSNTWMVSKEIKMPFYRVFVDDVSTDSYMGDGREMPFVWGATSLDRFIFLCVKWLNPELYAQVTGEAEKDLRQKAAEYRKTAENPNCVNGSEWHLDKAAFFDEQAGMIDEIMSQYQSVG